jgi:hypothetical protein
MKLFSGDEIRRSVLDQVPASEMDQGNKTLLLLIIETAPRQYDHLPYAHFLC